MVHLSVGVIPTCRPWLVVSRGSSSSSSSSSSSYDKWFERSTRPSILHLAPPTIYQTIEAGKPRSSTRSWCCITREIFRGETTRDTLKTEEEIRLRKLLRQRHLHIEAFYYLPLCETSALFSSLHIFLSLLLLFPPIIEVEEERVFSLHCCNVAIVSRRVGRKIFSADDLRTWRVTCVWEACWSEVILCVLSAVVCRSNLNSAHGVGSRCT